LATINTTGSNFDTVLAVYTGSSVSGLAMITCNDDIASGNLQSQVTFTATAGTTYRIQVGGFSSTSGIAVGNLGGSMSGTPPTPTPSATCSPRPTVSITSTPAAGGRLQVTISPSGNARLLSLQVGAAANALIDINGQTNLTGNMTVTLPPETVSLTFFVRHATAGQATTVPLTVTDGCGTWPTLVGGGPSAF